MDVMRDELMGPEEEKLSPENMKAVKVLSVPLDLGNGLQATEAETDFTYHLNDGLRTNFKGAFSVFMPFSDPRVISIQRQIEELSHEYLEAK